MGRPFELHDMHQREMTYAGAAARARLDRFYYNGHLAEQLDRDIRCVALEWKPGLSQHRAVLFSRRAPQWSQETRGFQPGAEKHEDFPRRTALAFQQACDETPDATGLHRLRLLKRCMTSVARRLGAAPGHGHGE